jgi:hypothetical protein
VSMLIDAWRSLVWNGQETDENGQEQARTGLRPGSFEVASWREFPVMEGRCHVTHTSGATLFIVAKAPGNNATGSQASSGGRP